MFLPESAVPCPPLLHFWYQLFHIACPSRFTNEKRLWRWGTIKIEISGCPISRVHDLRGHFRAEHGVYVMKERVGEWVKRAKGKARKDIPVPRLSALMSAHVWLTSVSKELLQKDYGHGIVYK